MDALIYTLMSGAERALRSQQLHANNLANLDTPGFRADLELATSEAVTTGYGYDARHMSRLQANSVASREGSVRETGRDLDVAIAGQGYFTVQWQDTEAYSRAGTFAIDENGALTLNGHAVIGDGGPIALPPHSRLEIGDDGTISIQAPGQADLAPIDRLKLVRPEPDEVTKNTGGFIVARAGGTLPADESVKVRGGYLEGSNVSAIEEMVATMNLNREFEIQMKLYRAADAMAESGNRLVRE